MQFWGFDELGKCDVRECAAITGYVVYCCAVEYRVRGSNSFSRYVVSRYVVVCCAVDYRVRGSNELSSHGTVQRTARPSRARSTEVRFLGDVIATCCVLAPPSLACDSFDLSSI